ncbi:hypothetical protein MRB53_002629 [Persea americana]|uniref:Uncharacterized protein n=1 Tax=Persea americana TaxID=3435 RepID=A0ACC2MVA4_PERAE|nr:hypothetical protein MRB53_002629 [Persea americana]
MGSSLPHPHHRRGPGLGSRHFRSDRLGELNDHALRAPNSDDEVRAGGLEGVMEVCNGFGVDDKGAGVEAEEGEEGEGVSVETEERQRQMHLPLEEEKEAADV